MGQLKPIQLLASGHSLPEGPPDRLYGKQAASWEPKQGTHGAETHPRV